MSEIDDLEEIGEASRYGYNTMKRGISKATRAAYRLATQRAAAAQRSVAKQQYRSSDRRRVLARIENRE